MRIDRPSRLRAASPLPDLLADQRRQPFRSLVEHQQLRIGHQGAADRQHLLLAAGDLVAEIARGARPAAARRRRRARASRRWRLPRGGRVATRFSSTVRVGKICRPSGTRPMPAWAMRKGGAPARPRPSKAIGRRLWAVGPSGRGPWWSCPCRCGPSGSPPRPRPRSRSTPNRTCGRRSRPAAPRW